MLAKQTQRLGSSWPSSAKLIECLYPNGQCILNDSVVTD